MILFPTCPSNAHYTSPYTNTSILIMCSLKFTLVYWIWGSTGVAFWASSVWWSRVSLSSDIDTATSSSPETDNTYIFDVLQLSEVAFIVTWHRHVKFSTLRSPRSNSNRESMLKSSVILQQQQQQQWQQQNSKSHSMLVPSSWDLVYPVIYIYYSCNLSYKPHTPQSTPVTHSTFKPRKI